MIRARRTASLFRPRWRRSFFSFNVTEPGDSSDSSFAKSAAYRAGEAAATSITTLLMLAAAGYCYHEYYQFKVIHDISSAFEGGIHPDLQGYLVHHQQARQKISDDSSTFVYRDEQAKLNQILAGEITGRYFLLVGEQGTGKTSMLVEAVRNVNGFNCCWLEAHADPEIFRIRLGEAFNFRFAENYIGSLFSMRGPRDTTALLDIERAFQKLQVVAIKRFKKYNKPLVIIISGMHLIRHNDDGQDLVELLQQKAETLASSGLATVIFNSNDYWVYQRLKRLSTRLEVLNIRDLPLSQACDVLKSRRKRYWNQDIPDDTLKSIVNLVGGRPQHLNQVAQHSDMKEKVNEIIQREKTWFLNHCALLGTDMDDDVMEYGKFSTSAMLLAKALVEQERRLKSNSAAAQHNEDYGCKDGMPELPLWFARQVMTRPDYIEAYDHLNIFAVDAKSHVRADSLPMMQAFREIVNTPGFDEQLERSIRRVAAIESLGRTREIVAKDLVLKGAYKISTTTDGFKLQLEPPEQQDEEELPCNTIENGFTALKLDIED
ncbi:hypothetical protein CANCADRAFT_138986 [Tortispora caseinolytica NRRL Y-17796]|uniref:AAA protein C-terminal winged helix domain-containing protein n=1 Tax=Tortispora caseinolytica NRRL Y-17796 TaxID=767744 RepID=A0A1E4TC81_9ASCO|nr:hypothetical protein CANCADRAFT_138986 [Tortispora caseinolytica NRRL Y-17796]